MPKRPYQHRKSALASNLLPYLDAVAHLSRQKGGRERRLLKRLFRTRGQGGADAAVREATGREMLHALRRYAQGESLLKIAQDFHARGVGGVSEVSIFRAGQRFERWWGEGRAVEELDELLELLGEFDPYRGSLTRELVPTLHRSGGARSGLPPELRWRRWTLPEVWLFVRTGSLPPRVLYEVCGSEETKDWVSLTAQLAEGRAEAEDLKRWEGYQKKWQRRHRRAAGDPLAPRATREAVRKALLRGHHPHRWVSEEGLFRRPPGGHWVPEARPATDGGAAGEASAEVE